jgi:hypothetical protein
MKPIRNLPFTSRLNSLCCAVILLGCAHVQLARADALDDAVNAIQGVGFSDSISTKADDATRLVVILTASPERVEQWLVGTSRQKSAAILVLSDRGEVNRLASLSHLLADQGAAIAGPGLWASIPSDESRFYRQRTVGQQLAHVLEAWLGVGCDTPERFARDFAGITDFNTLATPWVRRLEKAAKSSDPTLLASIKQQVAALNPDIRWVVIAEASNAKMYNDEPPLPVAEARSMMQALSAQKKAALLGNDPVVPPDPKYQSPSSATLAYTRSLAKELLSTSP